MTIRDRIKELRRVKASELVPSPHNWREHPEGQVNALRGILDEIGYADVALTRELPDGRLGIIDGHMRAELDPDQELPVLVLDLDEDEAKKLLTVLDPLAAMAEANKDALGQLLLEIDTESEAVRAMLEKLAEQEGVDVYEGGAGELLDVEPQIDRAEELQKEWKTETGQLWEVPGNWYKCPKCGKVHRRPDGEV